MTLKEFVVKLGYDVDQQSLDKFNGGMKQATETVKQGIEKINQNAGKIKEFSNKLSEGINKGLQDVKQKVADLPLAQGISTAMSKAKNVVDSGINTIKGAFGKLKDVAAKINMNPFVQGIKKGLSSAANVAKSGLNKIKGLFSKFTSGLKGIGGKIQSQLQGIFSLKGAAIFTAATVATKKIYDGVKKLITGFTELNRETYATDKAMEIMGKTMDEIKADPKLLAEFNELKGTVDSIGLPSALPESVKLLDDITKGVKKLKMIFDVFLKWVGYYLLKYLDKPLKDIKAGIEKLTSWLTKNMQKITEMVAKAITKVVKVVQHVFQFLGKIFNVAKKVLDKIPDSVKKIGLAFLAFWKLLKTNPLMLIIGILGLLIDDFMTFLEGGESALGGVWKAVMKFIDGLGGIDGIIDKIMSFATVAIGWVIDIIKTLIQWVKNMWKWLKESGTLEKLKKAFISIFNSAITIIKLVITTIMKLWNAIKESGVLEKVGKLVSTVFTTAVQIISKVIEIVVKLWQKISESGALDKLFGTIGKVFGFIIDTVQKIIGWFSNLWGKVSEGGGIFDQIVEVVGGFISTVVDLIATVADLVVGFYQLEPVQAWFEMLGNIIGTVVKGAIQLVIDTIGVLKNIIDVIVKLVKGDFQGAFKSAGDAITGIFKGVANVLSGIKNLVGDIIGGIGKVVKSGIDKVTGGGKSTGHAEGGIFDKEHVANFAENDKMEAVVPLEGPNKKKGIGIAKQVNEILGINKSDDKQSNIIPVIKDIVSKALETVAMTNDMRAATEAYNEIINNNVINNTYNTTQPIQLTVQVQMPSGGKVSTQEARRFGTEIGKGISSQLNNGIMMDNRQGAFA